MKLLASLKGRLFEVEGKLYKAFIPQDKSALNLHPLAEGEDIITIAAKDFTAPTSVYPMTIKLPGRQRRVVCQELKYVPPAIKPTSHRVCVLVVKCKDIVLPLANGTTYTAAVTYSDDETTAITMTGTCRMLASELKRLSRVLECPSKGDTAAIRSALFELSNQPGILLNQGMFCLLQHMLDMALYPG